MAPGLFRFRRFMRTERHAEVWARYEKIFTGLDFTGLAFLAAKPTVRLLREIHLARLPLPGDDMGGEVVRKPD